MKILDEFNSDDKEDNISTKLIRNTIVSAIPSESRLN